MSKVENKKLGQEGSDLFKLGNKKLGKDTIIFNMTAAHDCAAQKSCSHRKHCYARADERMRPAVLAYRRRQMAFWSKVNPDDFVDQMPIPRYFRFSESGDFRNQADVDKMVEVAKRLKKRGIITYGYTNRRDLDFSRLTKFAVVNGSGFMVSNEITVTDKPEDGVICPGDCRDCKLCKVPRGRRIQFLLRRR